MQHSGINILDCLLRRNFNEYEEKAGDKFEWKYSYVHDLDLKNTIAPDIPCVIVCVRDPYDWMWEFCDYNHYRLRDPIFEEDFQEGYKNVPDLYNQRLKNYKNLIEHNDGIFIRYEDIILRQNTVLKKIVDKFKLNYKHAEIKPYYNNLDEKVDPIDRIQPIKYYCYKDLFKRYDQNFVMHRLDPDLMEYFEYSS